MNYFLAGFMLGGLTIGGAISVFLLWVFRKEYEALNGR